MKSFTGLGLSFFLALIIVLFGVLLLLGYKMKGILDKKTAVSPLGILLIGIGLIILLSSIYVNSLFLAGLAIMFTGTIILVVNTTLQLGTALKKQKRW